MSGHIYIIQDPDWDGYISYESIGCQKELGIQLYPAYNVFPCSYESFLQPPTKCYTCLVLRVDTYPNPHLTQARDLAFKPLNMSE